MRNDLKHPGFLHERQCLAARCVVRTPARLAILAIVLLLSFVPCARAIDIDETLWGFDGRVTADCFNPLSLLVSNRSSTAFDGTLILQQSVSGSVVDAQLVEPVYLSPNSSRWVQFYPYVKYGHENWEVRSSSKQQFPISTPTVGDRAPVLLVDPGNFLATSTALKRYPENLFPPFVGATDGLTTMFIDHVPRWEESRRQAFLDWLHRGGIVHLMQGETGKFPEFPPALSVLNQELPAFRVGSGAVVRHPSSAGELDKQLVASLIAAPPKFKLDGTLVEAKPVETADGPTADKKSEVDPAVANALQMTDEKVYYDLPMGLFSQLKSLTKVEHHWVFIYLLSMVYIALIFPGFYFMGMKRRDYRLIYGLMLGVIALFSLAFAYVGRRGYGEATTMHSVVLARPASNGGLDVMGWTNAFATIGDDYVIDYDGTGKMYSTCQQVEAVNGSITSGANGQFVVDIPPYSARSFVYRCRTESGLKPKLVEFSEGTQLDKLEVDLGSDIESSQWIKGLVMRKDRFYTLSLKNGVVRPDSWGSQSMQELIQKVDQSDYRGYGTGIYAWQESKSPNALYSDLFWPLVLRSFENSSRKALQEFVLPDDRARLFLYVREPDSMKGQLAIASRADRDVSHKTGCVLYVFDVFPEIKP